MIWTIAMGKGGVGKSTLAAELAAYLARRDGGRVLAIDLDRQGNMSRRLDIDEYGTAADAVDVLTGTAITEAVTASRSARGVDVVASAHSLADMEATLEPRALAARLEEAPRGRWAHVVIDTPPSLGGLVRVAIEAAESIILPVRCNGESIEEAERTARWIKARTDKEPAAVIPTIYDRRKVFHRDALAEMTEIFTPERVTPPVPDAVAVEESYLIPELVTTYRPNAPVSHAIGRALDAATR